MRGQGSGGGSWRRHRALASCCSPTLSPALRSLATVQAEAPRSLAGTRMFSLLPEKPRTWCSRRGLGGSKAARRMFGWQSSGRERCGVMVAEGREQRAASTLLRTPRPCPLPVYMSIINPPSSSPSTTTLSQCRRCRGVPVNFNLKILAAGPGALELQGPGAVGEQPDSLRECSSGLPGARAQQWTLAHDAPSLRLSLPRCQSPSTLNQVNLFSVAFTCPRS